MQKRKNIFWICQNDKKKMKNIIKGIVSNNFTFLLYTVNINNDRQYKT